MPVVHLPQSTQRRVFEVLRALFQNVSWNFRAIWLDDIGPKHVAMVFLLEFEDDEDAEAIEDTLGEFEAMQDCWIQLDVQTLYSQSPLHEFSLPGYLVYVRWQGGAV